jgi:hypothetical protein
MLGVLAYGLASAATSADLSVPSWNERYFSPNEDDQEDTATVLKDPGVVHRPYRSLAG